MPSKGGGRPSPPALVRLGAGSRPRARSRRLKQPGSPARTETKRTGLSVAAQAGLSSGATVLERWRCRPSPPYLRWMWHWQRPRRPEGRPGLSALPLNKRATRECRERRRLQAGALSQFVLTPQAAAGRSCSWWLWTGVRFPTLRIALKNRSGRPQSEFTKIVLTLTAMATIAQTG